MTPDRHARIEELFHHLVALDAETRAAWRDRRLQLCHSITKLPGWVFIDVDLLMTGDTSEYQSASNLRIYGMKDNLNPCGQAVFGAGSDTFYETFVLTLVE